MRRMLATEVVGGLSQTAMGAILALVPALVPAPVTAFRPCSGAAPPVLGGFPAVMPRFALSCVLAQTARPPPGVDPPGSGLFCKKMGPNLTLFRGSGRLYRSHRRDSRRWLRYNPRSEAFTSSVPRSAAYETAQTFARALANAQYHFTLQAYETAQSFAWHFRPRIRPSVEQPTKPPRALLGRYVGPWTALKTA